MAVTVAAPDVRAIDRFRLVSADGAKLSAFYAAAFDARVLGDGCRTDDPIDSARSVALAIGDERIELVTFDDPGAPYPADSIASDVAFQHFAIVVADMDAAYARLQAVGGWTSISRGGPQRLPANAGGVTAFKFRDPEGHPLELIEFRCDAMPMRWKDAAASGVALGIDHTAISVADAAASIAFYAALGLRVGARSTNRGAAQDRLDGIDAACVEVIALLPPEPTPHIELLCYVTRRATAATGPHDIAATQIVFGAGVAAGALQDPDGHRLFVRAID